MDFLEFQINELGKHLLDIHSDLLRLKRDGASPSSSNKKVDLLHCIQIAHDSYIEI